MWLFSHPYVDWLFTIISAIIIYNYTSHDKSVNTLLWATSVFVIFVILLIISIPFHVYFDVPTNTNYYLRLSKKPIQQ